MRPGPGSGPGRGLAVSGRRPQLGGARWPAHTDPLSVQGGSWTVAQHHRRLVHIAAGSRRSLFPLDSDHESRHEVASVQIGGPVVGQRPPGLAGHRMADRNHPQALHRERMTGTTPAGVSHCAKVAGREQLSWRSRNIAGSCRVRQRRAAPPADSNRAALVWWRCQSEPRHLRSWRRAASPRRR